MANTLSKSLLDKSARKALREVVCASVVLNCFMLAAPVASIVIFNKVLPHQATATLTVVATGMVIIYIFDLALRNARNFIAVHTGARLDAAIGNHVVQHLLRLPLHYFERTSAGEILERLRQLDTVRGFLTGEMPLLLVDLAFSVLGIAVLFAIDWRMGLLALFMLPLFAGASFLADGTQRKLSEASFTTGTAKAGTLNEIITGALTIKAMGLQPHMSSRYGARLAESAWASFRSQNLAGFMANISHFLHGMASLTVLILGAGLIINGELSVGALVASSMLVGRSLAPVRYLATAWHRLREAQQAFARLNKLMQEAPEATSESGFEIPSGRQPLRCAHVQFSHMGGQRSVLTDVTLTLAPGTITALVGASGCGKTTLGKVLAGIYAPNAGRVTVGNLDVTQIAEEPLRRHLGYVPQEAQLFAGTVLDNILFGLPAEATTRAFEAAQFTGAHMFIQSLPEGYNTRVGEGGIGLSAGQRQLLSITRVIVRNPRVLILDEVTSALDQVAEAHLMRNLQRAAKSVGVSILVITHRPSTLVTCDHVALLAGGKIVKEGTAEEMMPLLLAKPQPKSAPTIAEAS